MLYEVVVSNGKCKCNSAVFTKVDIPNHCNNRELSISKYQIARHCCLGCFRSNFNDTDTPPDAYIVLSAANLTVNIILLQIGTKQFDRD